VFGFPTARRGERKEESIENAPPSYREYEKKKEQCVDRAQRTKGKKGGGLRVSVPKRRVKS